MRLSQNFCLIQGTCFESGAEFPILDIFIVKKARSVRMESEVLE